MTNIEELKQQIQNLSAQELVQLRSWFWDQAPPLDAEWLKEAEDRLAARRSGELAAVDVDEVFKELGYRAVQRRYRELLEDKVKSVPGPAVFQRLRERFRR